MRKLIAATTLALAIVSSAGAAHAATAYGYENVLSTSWGRTDHTFKPDGTYSGKLSIRLADSTGDSDCVYAKATVRVNYGPDYTRDMGRVCGGSNTFSHTFTPVVGTSIRGVDVTMCRDRSYKPDPCVTEYNAR